MITIGSDEAGTHRTREAWRSFDVENCRCFDQDDKARILGIIGSHAGGARGFNGYIRSLAEIIFGVDSGAANDILDAETLIVEEAWPSKALFRIYGAGVANLNGYYGDFGGKFGSRVRYKKMNGDGSLASGKEQVFYNSAHTRWVMFDGESRYINLGDNERPPIHGWVVKSSGAPAPYLQWNEVPPSLDNERQDSANKVLPIAEIGPCHEDQQFRISNVKDVCLEEQCFIGQQDLHDTDVETGKVPELREVSSTDGLLRACCYCSSSRY